MTEYSWFDSLTCPVCNQNTVPYYGYENSKALILGAYPGDEEIKAGLPMVGPMGGVLRAELRYLGANLDDFWYGNLWLHQPNDECHEHCVQEAVNEISKREIVLLLGSEPTKLFLDKGVTDVCGLMMNSFLVSVPIMACVNPAVVFQSNGTVGEMRLALKKFIKKCKEMNIV